MSSIRTIALAKAIGGGGGGASIEVEELTVSQNGTTTAPEGKAYSPVVVNVQPPLQQKTVNANGDVTPDEGYYGLSKVVVEVPQGGGGGGGVAAKAVNFRDYDGTIVQSYSAADFAALTAMPDNPSHDGLTAQGWNWTLVKAQAYVAKYGRLEIGQMYITDDDKTRVYIHLEQGRTSPMLGVCPNGTVDVDWGDGTAHDTLTGTSTSTVQWTPNHAYAALGDYVIKLTVTGSMGFYGNSSSNQYSGLLRYASSADSRNYVYRNAIQKVEIGSSVTNIGISAFSYCYSLASVTIPDNVTSIGDNAFYYCYSLANITIPDGVTSIGDSAFSTCYSLASVTIPDSVTSIGSSAFYYCYGVAEYHLARIAPPTLSNTNAFSGIASDCIIYVPYSADHSILEAYKTAANWSTYASKMQEEAT